VQSAIVNNLARGAVTEEYLAVAHASSSLLVETQRGAATASKSLACIDSALRFGVLLLWTVEIIIPDDSRISFQRTLASSLCGGITLEALPAFASGHRRLPVVSSILPALL
jgi:hypothetical protein